MATVDALNARIAKLDAERCRLRDAIARNLAERCRLVWERDALEQQDQGARALAEALCDDDFRAWREGRRQ